MTTSSRIPPSTPVSTTVATPVDRNNPVSPVTPAAPARPVIRDAMIIVLPEELRREIQAQVQMQLTGTVVEKNAASGEMRIRTESGDIVIRTEEQIPPGREVRVTLTRQEAAAALASITVTGQQEEALQTMMEAVKPQQPPLPPLKPGDSVMAIYIPATSPSVALPQDSQKEKYFALQTIAAAFREIKQSVPVELIKAAIQFNQIPDVVQKILMAENIPQALSQLPPAEQKILFSFLTAPATLDMLGPYLTPPTLAALQSHIPPQAIPAPPPEEDKNIFQALLPRLFPNPASSPTPPTENPTGVGKYALAPFISILENFSQPQTRSGPAPVPPGKTDSITAALPQNMQRLEIISILPPTAATSQKIPAPPAAGLITGQGGAPTPSGFPVIRTETGDFVLKTQAPLPPGSLVTFAATPLSPEQLLNAFKESPAVPERPLQGLDPLLSLRWTALEETLQTVSTITSDAAQALRNVLPSTAQPQRIAPTALLFLAVLRMGDLGSWLGENTLQALRQSGRKDLLERLTSDFGRISSQAREPVSGEWRPVSLPLLHQEQVYNLQFMVRQQHDPEKKEEEGGAKPVTRFILNLRLSRMGDMQLDGFLHKKRLDIILRSTDPLPFGARQEIMQKFYAGLDQVHLQGAISFQTRQQSWVNIETGHHAGTLA